MSITVFGVSTCLAGTLIKFERGPVNREIKQAGDKRLGDAEGDRKQLPLGELAALPIHQPKQPL